MTTNTTGKVGGFELIVEDRGDGGGVSQTLRIQRQILRLRRWQQNEHDYGCPRIGVRAM
jgi:hypothetical protein